MSRAQCVMCELSATVDILPVGKSLHKFGLLSRDIYHDLHKPAVHEGIKWRGLLHSVNFQENRLARLALIELVRIENPRIADELENSYFQRQIGCVCGLRTNGPKLKRSNSLSHIVNSSGRQSITFGTSSFNVSDDMFAGHETTSRELDDEKMKFMSLQPRTSSVQSHLEFRRSRSLEILRPFIALARETYVPKCDSDSDSDPDMDDEIDFIFSGIAEQTSNDKINDVKETISETTCSRNSDEPDTERADKTRDMSEQAMSTSEKLHICDEHFNMSPGLFAHTTAQATPTTSPGNREVGAFLVLLVLLAAVVVLAVLYLLPGDLLASAVLFLVLEVYTCRTKAKSSR